MYILAIVTMEIMNIFWQQQNLHSYLRFQAQLFNYSYRAC